jgi:hypothetical protein
MRNANRYLLVLILLAVVRAGLWTRRGLVGVSGCVSGTKKPPRQGWFDRASNVLRRPSEPLLRKLPAIALMIFSTSTVNSSPLDQQEVAVSGPFFQGWLIRGVDHDQNTSFITIAGSFSGRNTNQYTENYLFGAVSSPLFCTHEEVLLPAGSVHIIRNSLAVTSEQPLNIVWDAGMHGRLTFRGDACSGILNVNGRLQMQFNVSNRLPWRPPSSVALPIQFNVAGESTVDCARLYDYNDGPEGWLGLCAKLLPCHYFVHSVGSHCHYKITVPDTSGHRQPVWRRFGSFMRSNRALSTNSGGVTALHVSISGQGYAHIEGNHGTCFPGGWLWSQGIAPDNKGSFSLALGKFSIAGLTPTTCVLYVRRRNGRVLVFRTIDLARVHYATDRFTGAVNLNATSLFGGHRLAMTIRPMGNASTAFRTRLQVPTATGFSNRPGCLETYTATATIKIAGLSDASTAPVVMLTPDATQIVNHAERCAVDEEVYEFPLTALEYGGTFIGQHLGKDFCTGG